MEHAWRDKLDSRELIAKMIDSAPTVKEISTKIPINVFEQLISQEPKTKVLNKIRTEIEQEADYQNAYINTDIAKGMYLALEIFDKYKGGDNK